MSIAGAGVRLSIMFAALFVIHGVQLTYLPVWLDARGLTAAQIALATSAPTFVRLLATPAIAFLADRTDGHRAIILALCWTGLGLLALLSQIATPVMIILVVIGMQVAIQSIMPLADTLTMKAVRVHGFDYGRIRLWGSASFILASYLAGYTVAAGGPQTVVWLLISGAALTAAAAMLLPRPVPEDVTVGGRPRLTLAEAKALASAPVFLAFLVAASAVQASHALFYVFGVLHWRAQGFSAGAIGTLWGISVVAEIVLFWAARRITKTTPQQLILIGAAAGLVRWTAFVFDPPLVLLVPLQILHAATFAATHLGSMMWISRYVPEHQAGTAQALLSTVSSGIGMGGAILLSGWLYAAYGSAAYLGMTLLCVIGGAAALLLPQAAPSTEAAH